MRSYIPLIILLIFSLLPARIPPRIQPAEPGWLPVHWERSDLRAFDPPDASRPDHDLIAVYWRQSADWNHLRLDFLDIGAIPSVDLSVALDYGLEAEDASSAGEQDIPIWETLIEISAAGTIETISTSGAPLQDLSLRIERDPQLDTITLHWRQTLPQPSYAPLAAQIFTCDPLTGALVDRSPSVDLHPLAPPRPLAVWFAFWNTFPAYTPVQALRRWDGAHSGPFGGRHGLFNLLRVFRAAQVPLALLDAKLPASLAAMELTGGITILQEMAAARLLTLPDAIPGDLPPTSDAAGWLLGAAAARSRRAALNYGLPSSQLLFSPAESGTLSAYQAIIALSSSGDLPTVTIANRAGIPILAVSSPVDFPQITPQGLSLDARRMLAQAAATGIAPVFLGGDLARSGWGAPAPARQALNWIANHPWIAPANEGELLCIARAESKSGASSLPPLEGVYGELLAELHALPDSPPREAALAALIARYQPVPSAPEAIGELREALITPIFPLIAAAYWAGSPVSQANCSQDLDRDGGPDCILSSEHVWAWIQGKTAALVYLFVREESGAIHQLVAPSTQFIAGQGAPSTWEAKLGLYADPAIKVSRFTHPPCPPSQLAAPSGGCADSDAPAIETYPGAIQLAFPDRAVRFTIIPRGIQVEGRGFSDFSPRLYLAPDPWRMAQPGWSGLPPVQKSLYSLNWRFSTAAALEMRSSVAISGYSVFDSLALLKKSENPDAELPQGADLPLQMAAVTLAPASPEFLFILRLTGR